MSAEQKRSVDVEKFIREYSRSMAMKDAQKILSNVDVKELVTGKKSKTSKTEDDPTSALAKYHALMKAKKTGRANKVVKNALKKEFEKITSEREQEYVQKFQSMRPATTLDTEPPESQELVESEVTETLESEVPII